jgi:uracil-DNA glycosylase
LERDNCREYLERELDLLADVRIILTLGGYAYHNVLRILRDRGISVPRPVPKFAHGRVVEPGNGGPAVIASYHPSQQNTFTGKLTPRMLDTVLAQARTLAEPSKR